MSGTPTLAISGFGALFQAFDNNGLNPTTVNGITDIQITYKLNTTDASTFTSPNGWMEKVGLMKDAGTASITIQWLPNDPTGLQQQMLADLKGVVTRKYNILEPGTPTRTATFSALIGQISRPYKFNGILVATISLECTGEPIFS